MESKVEVDDVKARPPIECEGWLMKRGYVTEATVVASKWHRRYFRLKDAHLMYFVTEADPLENARGSIPLARAGLFTGTHSTFGNRYFEIHSPSTLKKFPLAAETDEEFAFWTSALEQSIRQATLRDAEVHDNGANVNGGSVMNAQVPEPDAVAPGTQHDTDAHNSSVITDDLSLTRSRAHSELGWYSIDSKSVTPLPIQEYTAHVNGDYSGTTVTESSYSYTHFEQERMVMSVEDERSDWTRAANVAWELSRADQDRPSINAEAESLTMEHMPTPVVEPSLDAIVADTRAEVSTSPFQVVENGDAPTLNQHNSLNSIEENRTPSSPSLLTAASAPIANSTPPKREEATPPNVTSPAVVLDYKLLAVALKDELLKDSATRPSRTPLHLSHTHDITDAPPFSPVVQQFLETQPAQHSPTMQLEDITSMRSKLFDALKRVEETEAHIAGMAEALRRERSVVLDALRTTEALAVSVPSASPVQQPLVAPPTSSRHQLASIRELNDIPSPRSLLQGKQLAKHLAPATNTQQPEAHDVRLERHELGPETRHDDNAFLEHCMALVQLEYVSPDFAPCISDYTDDISGLFALFEGAGGDGVSLAAFQSLLRESGVYTAAVESGSPIVLYESDVNLIFERLVGNATGSLTYAQFIAALLMCAVAGTERSGGVVAAAQCRLRVLLHHHLLPYATHRLAPTTQAQPQMFRQAFSKSKPLATQKAFAGPAVSHTLESRIPHTISSMERPVVRKGQSSTLFALANGSANLLSHVTLLSLSPLQQTVCSIPEVAEVFARDAKALKAIFAHYAKSGREGKATASVASSSRRSTRSASISSADSSVGSVVSARDGAAVMSLADFSKFGLEFSVWPTMMTQGELLRLGVEAVKSNGVDFQAVNALQYADFLEALGRVAIVSFVARGNTRATPAFAATQLLLFLDGGGGRAAMMKSHRSAGANVRFVTKFT